MKNIWNKILKFLLSKTTLDEKVAEKVGELKEQVDNIDEIDNKEE